MQCSYKLPAKLLSNAVGNHVFTHSISTQALSPLLIFILFFSGKGCRHLVKVGPWHKVQSRLCRQLHTPGWCLCRKATFACLKVMHQLICLKQLSPGSSRSDPAWRIFLPQDSCLQEMLSAHGQDPAAWAQQSKTGRLQDKLTPKWG